MRDLFDEWLKPRRAFRLGNAGEMGANPDQRIHEDARHLTELSTDLGIGLLQSSLLSVASSVYYGSSQRNVTFHVSRTQLLYSWIHGLVRPCLRGHCFLAQLARRPAIDRAQFRALRPGG